MFPINTSYINFVIFLSWSPRAGLLTVMNGARYLWYGKVGFLTQLLSTHLANSRRPGLCIGGLPSLSIGFTLLLPRVPKMTIQDKSQISCCQILKYK